MRQRSQRSIKRPHQCTGRRDCHVHREGAAWAQPPLGSAWGSWHAGGRAGPCQRASGKQAARFGGSVRDIGAAGLAPALKPLHRGAPCGQSMPCGQQGWTHGPRCSTRYSQLVMTHVPGRATTGRSATADSFLPSSTGLGGCLTPATSSGLSPGEEDGLEEQGARFPSRLPQRTLLCVCSRRPPCRSAD